MPHFEEIVIMHKLMKLDTITYVLLANDYKCLRSYFYPGAYCLIRFEKILEPCLSYDVASESEIAPCNKIDKPLVVYRFTGNFMTSITTLRTY